MSMEAELAAIRRLDALRAKAQESNDPEEWNAYFRAVAEADVMFGMTVPTAYETPEEAA